MSATKTSAQIIRETEPPPPTLTQRIALRTLVVLHRIDRWLESVESRYAKKERRRG